ncbi:MAG: hypothetical protein H6558_03045 [Lewinellaceae bacterium]|nr:hypothetical protein [Lewinellaceae bacterium]
MNFFPLRHKLIFLIFLSAGLATLESCRDETADFTSGSFYPGLGEPSDTTTTDTTLTVEEGCWQEPISIEKAESFNALFTRFGGGWTGGDATYSIPLPGGRNLWLFGDTFLGTVRADRSYPTPGLINNTFVIQDGEELTTLYTGSAGNASAFVQPEEEGWWYW